MEYLFDNLRNNFDFLLRTHITFSRKNYSETKDLKSTLRNIYYFHIFNKYFSKKYDKNLSILDIGSKNWEYVEGEYYFFESFAKDFQLNGIELDAHRLNSDFYSRHEIAKFYIKNLKNTHYIAGNLMNHKQKYDYIIWILPFITKYPLIKWGLPLQYFQPESMLNYAYELLNENGEMLIINQGMEEYNLQKKLNEKLNIIVQYFGEIYDEFNLFKNKRYCSKIIKNK